MRRWMSCRALCNIFSTVWRRGEGGGRVVGTVVLCIRTECLWPWGCSAGGAGAGPTGRGGLIDILIEMGGRLD